MGVPLVLGPDAGGFPASIGAEVSALLTVWAPLLAIPIGAMTFYLRSIREQQIAARSDDARRFRQIEDAVAAVTRRIAENERDYTAKEDWLRESLWTRQGLERVTESFARLKGGLDAAPLDPPLRSAGLDSARLVRHNGRPIVNPACPQGVGEGTAAPSIEPAPPAAPRFQSPVHGPQDEEEPR